MKGQEKSKYLAEVLRSVLELEGRLEKNIEMLRNQIIDFYINQGNKRSLCNLEKDSSEQSREKYENYKFFIIDDVDLSENSIQNLKPIVIESHLHELYLKYELTSEEPKLDSKRRNNRKSSDDSRTEIKGCGSAHSLKQLHFERNQSVNEEKSIIHFSQTKNSEKEPAINKIEEISTELEATKKVQVFSKLLDHLASKNLKKISNYRSHENMTDESKMELDKDGTTMNKDKKSNDKLKIDSKLCVEKTPENIPQTRVRELKKKGRKSRKSKQRDIQSRMSEKPEVESRKKKVERKLIKHCLKEKKKVGIESLNGWDKKFDSLNKSISIRIGVGKKASSKLKKVKRKSYKKKLIKSPYFTSFSREKNEKRRKEKSLKALSKKRSKTSKRKSTSKKIHPSIKQWKPELKSKVFCQPLLDSEQEIGKNLLRKHNRTGDEEDDNNKNDDKMRKFYTIMDTIFFREITVRDYGRRNGKPVWWVPDGHPNGFEPPKRLRNIKSDSKKDSDRPKSRLRQEIVPFKGDQHLNLYEERVLPIFSN